MLLVICVMDEIAPKIATTVEMINIPADWRTCLYTKKYLTKIHVTLILKAWANLGLLRGLILEFLYPSCYISYGGTGRIL
jgi:hypothetical protein